MAHKRSLIEIITDAAMTEPPETVAAALAVGRRILANRQQQDIPVHNLTAPPKRKPGKRGPGRPRKVRVQASEADGVTTQAPTPF